MGELQKGFFYTKCIYCGHKARKDKRHLASNRYGDVAYYCDDCMNRKTKREIDSAFERIDIMSGMK